MKKQTKLLILFSAIIAALAILLVIVTREDASLEAPMAAGDEGETARVAPLDGKVTHFEMDWSNGDHLSVEVVQDADGNAGYRVTNYPETVGFNQYYLKIIANLGVTFSADRVVGEDKTNLKKFGLTNPAVTIHYASDSGDSVTLFVGNDTAMQDYVYFCNDKVDAVYLETMLNGRNFLRTLGEYMEQSLLPVDWVWENGVNRAIASLESVDAYIKKTNTTLRLRRCTDAESQDRSEGFVPFVFEEPAIAYANGAALYETFVEKILSFTRGTSFVTDTPDDLSLYGLDDPAAVFTVRTQDAECTLLIGTVDDAVFYIMRQGAPAVMRASMAASALEFPFLSLISDAFLDYEKSSVSEISVSAEGTEARIAYTFKEGALADAAGASLEPETAEAVLDSVLAISHEGLMEEPFMQADVTIALLMKSGQRHTLEAQKLNSRQYAVRLDGADTGMYCRAADLEAVLQGIL